MYKSDQGWEAEAELDMNDPIVQNNFDDIKALKFGFSTGSVSHVVRRAKKANGTNHITQWAVGELSITRTPAEPKALIHNVKCMNDFYGQTPDDMYSEDPQQPMDESLLMKIIEMLLSELTKKHLEVLPVFLKR